MELNGYLGSKGQQQDRTMAVAIKSIAPPAAMFGKLRAGIAADDRCTLINLLPGPRHSSLFGPFYQYNGYQSNRWEFDTVFRSDGLVSRRYRPTVRGRSGSGNSRPSFGHVVNMDAVSVSSWTPGKSRRSASPVQSGNEAWLQIIIRRCESAPSHASAFRLASKPLAKRAQANPRTNRQTSSSWKTHPSPLFRP